MSYPAENPQKTCQGLAATSFGVKGLENVEELGFEVSPSESSNKTKGNHETGSNRADAA